MLFDPNAISGNLLLATTPQSEIEALAPYLEWVDFAKKDLLSEPNKPLEFAYFPSDCVCSVVAVAPRDAQSEVGLIGREGFVGSSLVLLAGSDPLMVMCQVQGRALRLAKARFLNAVDTMPGFRAVLLRFIHVLLIEAAHTVLANTSYAIEERLARWILMVHDRVNTTTFPITHEFMSLMLAVRRPSVTDALHVLEGKKLIHAMRGSVQVLDRAGLEALASGSYGQSEAEHRRLIGNGQ